MDKPAVSVVISCYNAQSTIIAAMDSLIDQSLRQIEIIVIDDASTDNTLDILNQYASKDARITILTNQVNRGLSYSLNRGIDATKSDIIARMDADDVSHLNRLKKQYDYMIAHPDIDILGSGVRYKDEQGHHIKDQILPSNHEEIIKRLFKKTLVFHPTIMIKKSVYQQYGNYDENLRWAEDSDLWYRIYDKVCFHNLPETLLDYTLKSNLNKKIVLNNLRVKWINLSKRGMVLSFLPYLLKDLITLGLRSVKNY